MSCVHVVSFCNLIGTVPEVDNFSRECYQALSSPDFEKRPGDEARWD